MKGFPISKMYTIGSARNLFRAGRTLKDILLIRNVVNVKEILFGAKTAGSN